MKYSHISLRQVQSGISKVLFFGIVIALFLLTASCVVNAELAHDTTTTEPTMDILHIPGIRQVGAVFNLQMETATFTDMPEGEYLLTKHNHCNNVSVNIGTRFAVQLEESVDHQPLVINCHDSAPLLYNPDLSGLDNGIWTHVFEAVKPGECDFFREFPRYGINLAISPHKNGPGQAIGLIDTLPELDQTTAGKIADMSPEELLTFVLELRSLEDQKILSNLLSQEATTCLGYFAAGSSFYTWMNAQTAALASFQPLETYLQSKGATEAERQKAQPDLPDLCQQYQVNIYLSFEDGTGSHFNGSKWVELLDGTYPYFVTFIKEEGGWKLLNATYELGKDPCRQYRK